MWISRCTQKKCTSWMIGTARATSASVQGRSANDSPSQIGALAQTRDGYLWLATQVGLFRFDGVRFGYRCENPVDLTDLDAGEAPEELVRQLRELGAW